MKTSYHPKSLVRGYKIGMKTESDYVAIPSKIISDQLLNVVYNGSCMLVNKATEKEKSISFNDKFGRGKYTLNYYLWKPNNSLFGIS